MNPKSLITLLAIGLYSLGYSQDSIWKAKALNDVKVLGNVQVGKQSQQQDCLQKLFNCSAPINEKLKSFKSFSKKHQDYEAGKVCLEIGYCLIENSDTNFRKYLYKALEYMKREPGSFTDKVKKIEFIYRIGICYFLLDDYKNASQWLHKAEKANYPDSTCIAYFQDICSFKRLEKIDSSNRAYGKPASDTVKFNGNGFSRTYDANKRTSSFGIFKDFKLQTGRKLFFKDNTPMLERIDNYIDGEYIGEDHRTKIKYPKIYDDNIIDDAYTDGQPRFVFNHTGGQKDTAETILEFDLDINGFKWTSKTSITKDYAFIETIMTAHNPKDTSKSKIHPNNTDWKNLLNSVSGTKLKDLANLSAPTKSNEEDDGTVSSISIFTNRTKYYCGKFYDNNPPEKLKKLMTVIQEIENRR